MILPIQNNCSKVQQYLTKTPLEYSKMLEYYQIPYEIAMCMYYDHRHEVGSMNSLYYKSY